MSLQGKVAVVTGGGSGIGRGICQRLAQDGIKIAVWDLNPDGAQETVDLITAAGGQAIVCEVDASSAEQIQAAGIKTRNELGPVAILVNNAGISIFESVLDITEEMWDRMMAVNLKGPFLCTKTILPDMLDSGWGRIVNISSSSMQQGAANSSRYAASKGGVVGFTKALAKELAMKGITVNNIPPGFIDTPMLRAERADIDQIAKMRPMGRAGKPEDIAEACAWLCSENSGYVTGQTISVNGGAYMV